MTKRLISKSLLYLCLFAITLLPMNITYAQDKNPPGVRKRFMLPTAI